MGAICRKLAMIMERCGLDGTLRGLPVGNLSVLQTSSVRRARWLADEGVRWLADEGAVIPAPTARRKTIRSFPAEMHVSQATAVTASIIVDHYYPPAGGNDPR